MLTQELQQKMLTEAQLFSRKHPLASVAAIELLT